MRRLRDYSLCLCLLLLWPLAVNADDSWRQIQTEARGQTVWFNAWGGDPAVNRYLAWVSEEVKRYYAIDLRIVPVADAADAVKRIQTEAQAGRRQGGSVDLLWINGENFRTLKQADLLLTGWAESLPNWRYVDQQKPVREDFSVATEGAESPWGSAQLTFIARRGQTPQPPTSPQALLAFARAHPGSVTYPRPPDFTGTALLEQLLIALTDQPAALRQPPQPATFAAVTAPLWRYLDALHPALWRAGKDFPASPARMDAMLNQGTLRLSLTFNPLHARQKAASGELPTDSYSFGFTAGTLGNVHFVTIPANARAVAGAKVVANFLLSPEAQLRKADAAVWGDPSVLDPQRLPDGQRQALAAALPQDLPPVLAEPHAAWVDALEQEWLRRYGTLILLAWGAMAAIYLPLFPAAGELVGAARSPAHWRALFADPQLGQALAATLVSTLLSVGGALLIALTIVAALWPSARWRRLASRLPLLLAVPHLALATAALLLFAEGLALAAAAVSDAAG